MNERIRELAKKSGFSLDANNIYTAKLEHLPITENMEKFAELIVKECADYVQFYYKDHACEIIAHDMKQHFGVE
mgnify:CR=1 FL=1